MERFACLVDGEHHLVAKAVEQIYKLESFSNQRRVVFVAVDDKSTYKHLDDPDFHGELAEFVMTQRHTESRKSVSRVWYART